MSNKNTLVVGSGFDAIFAAYYLRRVCGANVDWLPKSPRIGGILRGVDYGPFSLDLGCQVFDNFDTEISNLITELSGGQTSEIDISYSSRFAGEISKEMSAPDLSSLDCKTRGEIHAELTAANSDGLDQKTLRGYYETRWGHTAAELLEKVNKKIFLKTADQLDSSNRIFASLNRIRIFDDATAMVLKSESDLNDRRIALPRSFKPPYNTVSANLHPMPRSMKGFCDSAHEVMLASGIQQRSDASITKIAFEDDEVVISTAHEDGRKNDRMYDKVVWCDNFDALTELMGLDLGLTKKEDPVSMHVIYFFAPRHSISTLGYFHNYDDDLSIFRWSSMGVYSNQSDDEGFSFCCVEIPTRGGRLTEQEMAPIWDEMKHLDLVDGSMTRRPHYVFAKNCIRARKPGYSEQVSAAEAALDRHGRQLVFCSPNQFGRVPTAQYLRSKINEAFDA